jgi:hypothetical protein
MLEPALWGALFNSTVHLQFPVRRCSEEGAGNAATIEKQPRAPGIPVWQSDYTCGKATPALLALFVKMIMMRKL